MTEVPEARPSNIIPFPTVSEDEAHKAEMVKVWEDMVGIVLRKLAEARQELAEERRA